MEISARFSEFNIADVGDTKIDLSNNSNYNFTTVNKFNCRQSRFDTFKLDEIAVEVSFPEAHNTKIDIRGTSASFKGFSGNFRFGNVNLKLNPNVEYNLNYDGTHGQLKGVSSDIFKTRYVYNQYPSKINIQGKNADATCNIELVTNNVTFKIE